VIPYTVGDYLADDIRTGPIDTKRPEFDAAEKEVTDRINHFLNNKGTKPVDEFHRRLGKVMWDKCGMARNEQGLKEAIQEIRRIREEFYRDVRVPGTAKGFNQELEKAGRVADFLELGELMCKDALERNESCGGHFREEFQTPEGEALRDDTNYANVSAWEWTGDPGAANLHKEALLFDEVKLTQRSYK
jgi:succinate dehydrogenase / fumarate reductase flavoprotein subunit